MSTLNQNAPAATMPSGAAESGGHWYTVDDAGRWQPLYEPTKDYTLREARILHEEGKVAVPSVTTIFKVMAKGEVDKWQRKQVAKACWQQHLAGAPATEDEFIDTALATASGASRCAMDLGTRIHAAVEDALAGKDHTADMDIYVQAVLAKRAEMGIGASVQEECVGSTKYGYAGRCDDYVPGSMTIIDLKSRSAKGKTPKVPSYNTDPLQLSAYGFAKFGNPFFKHGKAHIFGLATNHPGVVTVHTWDGPELIPAFEAFLSLCATWRYLNRFDPRRKA